MTGKTTTTTQQQQQQQQHNNSKPTPSLTVAPEKGGRGRGHSACVCLHCWAVLSAKAQPHDPSHFPFCCRARGLLFSSLHPQTRCLYDPLLISLSDPFLHVYNGFWSLYPRYPLLLPSHTYRSLLFPVVSCHPQLIPPRGSWALPDH